MIVSTSKLKSWQGLWPIVYLDDRTNTIFACGSELGAFFTIPRSEAYWIEVSNKPQRGEWVEGEVRVSDYTGQVQWRTDGGEWGVFHVLAQHFLRHHFKLSEKPKHLWCRLVYE